MSPRVKTKPDTLENADAFRENINDIAKLQVKMREIQVRRDKSIQRIQDKCDPLIKEAENEIQRLLKQAERYADSNRTDIFERDLRTAETELASFGFRFGTPKLKQLKGWSVEKIVDAIKAKGWAKRFLKTSPTIRKTEIKNQLDAEQLSSIGYEKVSEECFWVEAKANEDA